MFELRLPSPRFFFPPSPSIYTNLCFVSNRAECQATNEKHFYLRRIKFLLFNFVSCVFLILSARLDCRFEKSIHETTWYWTRTIKCLFVLCVILFLKTSSALPLHPKFIFFLSTHISALHSEASLHSYLLLLCPAAFSLKQKWKLMGNEGKGAHSTDNLLKQIPTYKLISKLSNFRGLLKHLPEDTSAVSRRRFISLCLLRRYSTLMARSLVSHRLSTLPFRLNFRIPESRVKKTMTSLHLF